MKHPRSLIYLLTVATLFFGNFSQATTTHPAKDARDFYPDVAPQAQLVRKLLSDSGLDEIVARQKNALRLRKKYVIAEQALVQLKTFLERGAKIKRMGLIKNPEDLLDNASTLFGRVSSVWTELTTTPLGTERMTQADSDEFTFRLGRIIDELFNSDDDHQILTEIAERRFLLADREFNLSGEDKTPKLLEQFRVGPDGISAVGAGFIASGVTIHNIATGLILISTSQFYKFRNRRVAANQTKILAAVLADNKKTFCNMMMRLR